MTEPQHYTLLSKIFFWLFWIGGGILGLAYLGALASFLMSGAVVKSDGVLFVFFLSLLVLVQTGVLFVALKRFLKQTHNMASLLLLLAGVTFGLPFALFLGCVTLFRTL